MEPYREEVCSILCPKATRVSATLQQAMNEANNMQQLTDSGRLEMCQYATKEQKGNKKYIIEEMKIVVYNQLTVVN